MELHAKLIRSQLNSFKPFVANCSLEVTRKGQDKLGELMAALHKREVMAKEHDFGRFQGAWIMPRGESAGGGLIYALCLKLKALGLPLPCGLIGISPWTDLNGTGAVGLLVSAMVALLRYLPGGHLQAPATVTAPEIFHLAHAKAVCPT